MKWWINLPKCATLGIKYLPYYQEEAQVSILRTIDTSSDPLVQDIDPVYNYLPELSEASMEAIPKAKEITSPHANSEYVLQRKAEEILDTHFSYWNTHLSRLQVQKKLQDVTPFEETSQVWQRLKLGLPTGQLLLLIRASRHASNSYECSSSKHLDTL